MSTQMLTMPCTLLRIRRKWRNRRRIVRVFLRIAISIAPFHQFPAPLQTSLHCLKHYLKTSAGGSNALHRLHHQVITSAWLASTFTRNQCTALQWQQDQSDPHGMLFQCIPTSSCHSICLNRQPLSLSHSDQALMVSFKEAFHRPATLNHLLPITVIWNLRI